MSQRQSQQTQAPASSSRYSKRKRTQVNYYEEAFDLEDIDPVTESEDDYGVEQHSPAKKRKPAVAKPLPKRKIFPFLELPAEIRNMIYDYSLTDLEGINLISNTEKFRRTVCRQSFYKGLYTWDEEDLIEPSTLVPSLLAVNRQLYKEGRDFLYGNDFVVHDTLTLHSFMVNIGPRAAALIANIKIRNWGYGRGVHKAYNHACFATMISATNIKKLTVSGYIQCGHEPKAVARQIYRDGFPWLEAVGAAKGKVDAAVDVVDIDAKSFPSRWADKESDEGRESMRLFREELRKLLGAHTEGIAAKPAKKTKKA